MAFTGTEYVFRGARSQERTVQDVCYDADLFDIPCGKCDLCLVTRRYERALRISLEAEFWPYGTHFITLTFDDAHLGSGELDHDEWSQFMKNFRQKFCQVKYCKLNRLNARKQGRESSLTFKELRQVMCGEYGDTFGRKHFHGIIFNHSFSDLEWTGEYSKSGHKIFTSKSLQEVWKKGRVQVAEMSFDLALYVGSYVTDAMDDDGDSVYAKKQYGRFGRYIGLSWLRKYWKDVLSAGKVMLRDRDYPIPRYFLKKMEEEICPVEFSRWKARKRLEFMSRRVSMIEKGDGPLRRAKAKGRIFKSIHKKRRDNEVIVRKE